LRTQFTQTIQAGGTAVFRLTMARARNVNIVAPDLSTVMAGLAARHPEVLAA
jgi:hypothetical protein